MDSIQPLVSIIIPTYNGAKTLPRAIDSCLKQTYPNIEIIVVDDNEPGSINREKTEQTISSYISLSNFIYIKHEHNKNGSAARNTGVRSSHGAFLAFLDDDDYFFPCKIYNQVKRLSALPDKYVACYSRFIVTKNGRTIQSSGEMREGSLGKEALMRNLFIAAGSNLLVKREAYERINGFDETFQRNQDIEFIVRLLKNHAIAFDNTLGLVITVPSTHRRVNFIEVTEKYVDRFSTEINLLSDYDLKRFNKMIALQVFRYYLLSEKNFKKAYCFAKDRQLDIFLIIRYVIHLIVRKLKKKRYGFNL